MAFLKDLKGLLPQLGNPKFLHHLLEPVLLWGILFGVAAWMLSLWFIKDRKAQLCSLILIALSAFTVLPVMHYRKKAAPITVSSKAMLDAQNERRKDTQWVYYALGSLAVLGIFMTGEDKGPTGTLIGIAITAGGVATIIFSLWLHEKEAAVFHPDSRRQVRQISDSGPEKSVPAAKRQPG